MKKFLKLFIIFYIGSFLGFIVEEIWCFIKNGTLKLRQALIYEPLIPIYGLATAIIIAYQEANNLNSFEVFISGLIIASIIEYLSSYLQEKMFNTISWDYSDFPLNLNGRINLLYSIGFGALSVLVVKIYKIFTPQIDLFINSNYLLLLTIVVLVIFIIDAIISILACNRQKNRRENITAKTKLDKLLDTYYPDEKLNRIYNNADYIKKEELS